jgi:hypothetical protein
MSLVNGLASGLVMADLAFGVADALTLAALVVAVGTLGAWSSVRKEA